MASGPKMSIDEIFQRTKQPAEAAEQRARDARTLLAQQKLADDKASAKRERLMALRLEKEAQDAAFALANPPPAPVKARAKRAKPAAAKSAKPA
jgi:hypothetical protein